MSPRTKKLLRRFLIGEATGVDGHSVRELVMVIDWVWTLEWEGCWAWRVYGGKIEVNRNLLQGLDEVLITLIGIRMSI